MAKLKRAVIKEELVALTGDYKKAIALNQLLYWSERTGDFDRFIKEEKRRYELYAAAEEGIAAPTMNLTEGWIYKSAEDLSRETMLDVKPKAMREYLKSLVKNGWLEERKNPNLALDRTLQYRVNILQIQRDLFKLGYSLEGYKLDLNVVFADVIEMINRKDEKEKREGEKENSIFPEENSLECPNDEKENSIFPEENSVREGEKEKREGENEKREGEKENRKDENEKAITETITETLLEINTKTNLYKKDLLINSISKDKFWDLMEDTEFEIPFKDIRNKVTEVTFNTWFATIESIQKKGQALVITVPSEFNSNIIQTRYLDILKDSFKSIGINKIEIEIQT